MYIFSTFPGDVAVAAACGSDSGPGESLTHSGFSLPRASLIAPHVADVLTEQTVRRASLDHRNKNI